MSVRLRAVIIVALLGPLLLSLGSTPAKADDYLAKAYDKGSPFGMNTAFGNRVRDDEQDEAITLLTEAGVQWVREEIFWDRLQPEKGGPYLWGGDGSGFYNYDATIDRLHKIGR